MRLVTGGTNDATQVARDIAKSEGRVVYVFAFTVGFRRDSNYSPSADYFFVTTKRNPSRHDALALIPEEVYRHVDSGGVPDLRATVRPTHRPPPATHTG